MGGGGAQDPASTQYAMGGNETGPNGLLPVLVRERDGQVVGVLLCRRHARQVGLERVGDSVGMRGPRRQRWQATGMDEAAMALSSLDELTPLEALAVMYRIPCHLRRGQR